MSVLIDTTIWSLALRRRADVLSQDESRLVRVLVDLIDVNDILMIGPVRQEILSGIRDPSQFEAIRTKLRAWPDESITTDDWEDASRCFNQLRAQGIVASMVDCVICTLSIRRNATIFTTDKDFTHYAHVLPIRLFAHPSA